MLATDHPGSMKHIQVDTHADGIVGLTGTTHSQTAINEAIQTARSTETVNRSGVISRLWRTVKVGVHY